MFKENTENTENLVFQLELTVPPEAIDENGHVNNVVYIQWMQDVAISHSEKCGGTAVAQQLGCSWVVREHNIIYLHPAFNGERIVVHTWVENFRRVRSLRRYRFYRKKDNTLLAKGETDWVFIKTESGKPSFITEEVQRCFPLFPEYE